MATQSFSFKYNKSRNDINPAVGRALPTQTPSSLPLPGFFSSPYIIVRAPGFVMWRQRPGDEAQGPESWMKCRGRGVGGLLCDWVFIMICKV